MTFHLTHLYVNDFSLLDEKRMLSVVSIKIGVKIYQCSHKSQEYFLLYSHSHAYPGMGIN